MMTTNQSTFADLLERAVTDPGIVSAAYRQFHNYSIGNQLLAWSQCIQRGIQPGPLATFPKWKELGRYVRKGERAIVLCQPVSVKRTVESDHGIEDQHTFTRFVYRPHWFVLAQTEGQELAPTLIPRWDRAKALATLNITEVPFDMMDGNVQGYARQRSIAVSPIAAMPLKTTFHEAAHVLLGHTSEAENGLSDSELTPRNLREVEAECVAMLCLAALDLPGVEFCRGYVQSWWKSGEHIPERSAQRVLKVADQILRAGTMEGNDDAHRS
jgi:antirestriction protein ArdC